ncbi:AMP-binding protein [Specibacter sp. NPDC057265]|uniref:AMP-binding protein n=1 Tax=Specibacter sp. NPDC057265 TaxID=3346075 RepID=UPI003641D29D
MGKGVQERLAAFSGQAAGAVHLFCDGHRAQDTALSCVAAKLNSQELNSQELSYGELREKSTRFAAALSTLGVGREDRVAMLMAASANWAIALLGIWRLGAVAVPLATTLAQDRIAFALRSSGAGLVIGDADQRRRLVPPGQVPTDASTPVVVAGGEAFGYDHSFAEMVAGSGSFSAVPQPSTADASFPGGPAHGPVEDPAGGSPALLQLFTPDRPAGVDMGLQELGSFVKALDAALDVRRDDVLLDLSDAGGASGNCWALIAALASGRRALLLPAGFDARLVWAVMDKFKVTKLVATAGVYKSLQADSAPGRRHRLRRASSTGEPLAAEVVAWALEALGVEPEARTADGTLDKHLPPGPDGVPVRRSR